MGGSSGVLLSIFFTAAGEALQAGAALPAAFADGLTRLKFYGGAAPGDRTLIDALEPALTALPNGLAAAAAAAATGAASTAALRSARAGRSAYLDAASLEGVADPGAVAVATAFKAASTAFAGAGSGPE